MKTLTKTVALAVFATTLAGASAYAIDVTQRGPLPFNAWDMNNDGYVSQDEFSNIRAKRQAARAAEGRRMMNAGNAPKFTAIDTDGDGKISRTEFANNQALNSRRGPRGAGMGRGMGRRFGMGNGRGPGRGMGRGMGPCQQQ